VVKEKWILFEVQFKNFYVNTSENLIPNVVEFICHKNAKHVCVASHVKHNLLNESSPVKAKHHH